MSDGDEKFQGLLSALMVISGMEDKTTASPDLAAVLKARLVKASGILNEPILQALEEEADLRKVQYITAMKLLDIILKLQDVLDQEETQSSGPPLLGTRDIACVKTALSIVLKWGLEPLMAELDVANLECLKPAVDRSSTIIDLTDKPIDLERLPVVLADFMHLMFKEDMKKIRQSWITSSLLSNYAVDILSPLLILGWSPKPILGSPEQKQQLKTFSIRFLGLLRTADATSALGTILASAAPKRRIYPHLPKTCGFLLSKQLLRPDGLQGLYIAVFGEEDSESAPLDKLEQIVKVLTAVPASMTPESYYATTVPKIIAFLTPSSAEKTPMTHKRASAFTLSRLLLNDFNYYPITSTITLPYFHKPFQQSLNTENAESEGLPTPMDALLTLQTFILNTDPSPEIISALLTPIISELYSLYSLCVTSKTADPSIRETIHGLLITWSRVVSSPEVVEGIWSIICGSGGDWNLTLSGFSRSASPSTPSISLQSVAELEGKTKDEIDIDANPFNLRPDPARLVGFMKTMDRKDISSDILIRLLNRYQNLKEKDRDEDAIQILLSLQLILQMQAQLSDAVVSKPEHILTFIKHALQSLPKPPLLTTSTVKKGLSLKDLNFVQKVEEEESADSDDEDLGDSDLVSQNAVAGKGDMAMTAVTLLLSVLEGNPDLSSDTSHDLRDIAESIESITSHTSATPALRQLAREARLVLLARLASTSVDKQTRRTTKANQPTANDIYQQALKLLQDPIIPVRARGLQLLRDLLSKRSKDIPQESHLDPALLPGILSIFLQSIQDQESYIFLNAVQGLAAMVDGYGKEVLKGIMDIYLQGTGIKITGASGSSDTMSQEELDARIRVGEALNNVVRRCGGALVFYIDVLLPPLLSIIQTAHLPTVLRVSALSVIAQCALTNVTALNSYADRLVSTCVEIVKLEHVSTKFSREKETLKDASIPSDNAVEEQSKKEAPPGQSRQPDQIELDPTTSVTKAPSLRRSALHLLATLFRAHIQLQYDALSRRTQEPTIDIRFTAFASSIPTDDFIFSETLLRHANVVLGYVAAVDQDLVTKVMANEVMEIIKQYREARLESM